MGRLDLPISIRKALAALAGTPFDGLRMRWSKNGLRMRWSKTGFAWGRLF
jgi:hypothetical protein